MCVFGGSFSRAAAAALGELPEAELDGALESLVRKQVLSISADPLSPQRGQYNFSQGLLRTVAYEMLSRRERKPRHRASAEYLRRTFPNDGEEVAEVVASHYLDAYRAARDDEEAPSCARRRSPRYAERRSAPRQSAHRRPPNATIARRPSSRRGTSTCS